MPAFNSGPLLDVAIASVVAQTFGNWELLVVDDGSSEDLSRVGGVDPRVRLIRQANAGVAMARNRGIAEAAGEFVAFLDHDDAYLPTKLANQVAAMRADGEAGLSHTAFAVMDECGAYALPTAVAAGPPLTPGSDFLGMLHYGAPFPTNTMVRRSVFGHVGIFDPFLTPSEDQDLFIRIARFYRVLYVRTCEGLYRVHGGNTSKNYMVCYETLNNLSDRHRVHAAYRRDATAREAATRMMAYREKVTFGPQAYDAARVALRDRDGYGFALHLSRALRWSPRFTFVSIARYFGALMSSGVA